jgi:hypothetical protein
VQYRRGWGTYKRKRGLTLCYNCKRLGHIAKECGTGLICICCKIVGHEVEDCTNMISKVERMNIRQEKEIQETKSMLENHKEKESKKSQTMMSQLKETMSDHKDVNLPEIMK